MGTVSGASVGVSKVNLGGPFKAVAWAAGSFERGSTSRLSLFGLLERVSGGMTKDGKAGNSEGAPRVGVGNGGAERFAGTTGDRAGKGEAGATYVAGSLAGCPDPIGSTR